MPEYTPTTDEVREDFVFPWEGFKNDDRDGRLAAFDRWLAARDRENRAIGWDEGFDAGEKDAWDVGTEDHVCTPNPYRGDNR